MLLLVSPTIEKLKQIYTPQNRDAVRTRTRSNEKQKGFYVSEMFVKWLEIV